MKLRIVASLLLSVLSACATTTQPMSPASNVTPFVASDIPTDANNGLMFMALRAFEMDSHDKISSTPAVITGLSVKNLETNKTYNIFLVGDTAMTQLPAGTYCITNFRTYSNVDLPYCENNSGLRLDNFQIQKGMAENLGYVLIGINYRGSGGTVRYKPFYFFKDKQLLAQRLTSTERRRVDDFLHATSSTLETLTGTTWYCYTFGGQSCVFKFEPNGKLLYATTPESIYSKFVIGSWSADSSTVTIRFDGWYQTYSGVLKDGFLSGTVHDTATDSIPDMYKGANWLWYASTSPAITVPFNAGPTAKVIYLNGIFYPKDALEKGIKGLVHLHYKLPVSQLGPLGTLPTVSPSDVEIVESQPTGVFDTKAKTAVNNMFFANAIVDGRPIKSEGDVTITFDIINGQPMISYSSKLEPINPATSN